MQIPSLITHARRRYRRSTTAGEPGFGSHLRGAVRCARRAALSRPGFCWWGRSARVADPLPPEQDVGGPDGQVFLDLSVFEVKRDLRRAGVRDDAVRQLAGYVLTRQEQTGQRYVGVLTDGAEWSLWRADDDGKLVHVSTLELSADPDRVAVERLVVWVETVLATDTALRPTPLEVGRRLGFGSPGHALDRADLGRLYAKNKRLPTVALKRELWAKLLTTALGTAFADTDDLFVEHTLLVATAEIVAHAAVDIEVAGVPAATLLGGGLFADAQIGNVVDADFFDWVTEVPGGEMWVSALARRVSRFAWHDVDHDVMKTLYESVIGADTRRKLGEYYTPDWLAESVVSTAVTDPLVQRVLDPACGSGTFLFHAVRRYLAAAQVEGRSPAAQVLGATEHVAGVDVHPVAVTLARVTYLLALGRDLLRDPDRPAISVPVHLGDSIQWGQDSSMFNDVGLTVSTEDGLLFAAGGLNFPDAVIRDDRRFDQLVAELARRSADRAQHSPVPSLTGVFRRLAVPEDAQPALQQTFAEMCRLHDEGRDHIWGYYVRNLARPVWLSRPENRVDVLVGNPPWLSYRNMTPGMQSAFRALSEPRGLWQGATDAPSQDLAGLFLVRTVGLYLRDGGTFAYLLPLAVLTRRPYAGLRTGDYPDHLTPLRVEFDEPWDLHAVKPTFFPVPAAAVFGRRSVKVGPLTAQAETWTGRLPVGNPDARAAQDALTRCGPHAIGADTGPASPYAARFAQGATLVPRVLAAVEPAPTGSLGPGAGRRAVRSIRSTTEKAPWKDLPSMTGSVERQFVRTMLVGESLLPFRLQDSPLTVVPLEGSSMLRGGDDRLDLYPGLADWWRRAEAEWLAHRSSDKLDLADRFDYRRALTGQVPAAGDRVVYNASGQYLAAAHVTDDRAIVEHKLYWCAVAGPDEGSYLTAVLNADATTIRVRPLQARGEHNPRDFDLYPWWLPVPAYNRHEPLHARLVHLAAEATTVAAAVAVEGLTTFQARRRAIREALGRDGVASRLDQAVTSLLTD